LGICATGRGIICTRTILEYDNGDEGMKRAWCLLLSAVWFTLLLTACGSGESTVGDVDAGKTLFNTGGTSQIPCATCHSIDGVATVGPSLQGIAAHAGERIEGVSAEDYLRQSITQPSVYLVPGYNDVMYKDYAVHFSEEEIDNLVAYLMTLE
jgi:mono/diheme cytochrome c family protein